MQQPRLATLEQIMPVLLDSPESVRGVVQRRRHFNQWTYGEVQGFLNPSDGMLWDIFCPGYLGPVPRETPLPIKEVLGVMLTATGNHKIVVRLDVEGVPWCPFRAHFHFCSFRERYFMKKGIDCALYLNQSSSLSFVAPLEDAADAHSSALDDSASTASSWPGSSGPASSGPGSSSAMSIN